MTLTIQPLKNDQAVAPMVSNQSSRVAGSFTAGQPEQVQQQFDVSDSEQPDKNRSSAYPADTTTLSDKEATSRLAARQNENTAKIAQAQAVQAATAVESKLQTMKADFAAITNSYPPFLRGSEERQKYLMSISSIRQQIEAMTYPPNKFDNQTDEASQSAAKKAWTNLFQNVKLPELSASGADEASDAEVAAASAAVDAIQSDLAARRSVLAQQTTPSIAISSSAAQYISQATGQVLAGSGGVSLTTNLVGALKGM